MSPSVATSAGTYAGRRRSSRRAVMAVLVACISASADTSAEEGFVEAPCPFPIPGRARPGDDLVCGLVTVPESHGVGGGRSLRVGVAVFRSRSPNPLPDPIVMLAGGPGESTLEAYAAGIASPRGEPFRAQRDIVLVELRGLFHSDPSLRCPEVHAALRELLGRPIDDEAAEIHMRAVRACRDRLAAEGLDLSRFNGLESAGDLVVAMSALGYERFNLFGNSAGTTQVQHVLRRYGDRLRSVILGSVVPPMTDHLFASMPRNASDALDRSFARCDEDPECRAESPDGARRFRRLLARLDAHPALLSMQDPHSEEPVEVLLTGGRLSQWVFTSLYSTDRARRLPRDLARLSAGDYGVFDSSRRGADAREAFFVPPRFSWGLHYSVACSEHAGFRADEVGTDARYRRFSDAARHLPFGPLRLLRACAIWDVGTLPPVARAPVSSRVPALLLSGELDNVTPPRYADRVARGFETAHAFTLPGVAHSPIDGGVCPFVLVARFLEDPGRRPDDACIEGMRKGRALLEPFASRLARIVPSLLLLVSAVVAWSLSAVRSRTRPSRAVRRARGWMALAAALNLLFLIAFAASAPALLVLILFLLREPAAAVAGYPLALRVTLTFPILSLLPGLVGLGYAARAWRAREAGAAESIGYAIVVAALLVFVSQTGLRLL